jgi:1,4-dihydroxy-2-naphthoate octaprenyltransferase
MEITTPLQQPSISPSVLWRATRAYSLPASIVPVALGTVLAARGYGGVGEGRFDLATFLLVLIGGVLAHFGANVINDYFDFVNGVDTRPEHGSGVITGGQMTARHALIFALVLFAGAALCGLLLLRTRPEVVVPLALVGLACAVLYSAFLKRYGLGDLLIIMAFGIGLTLGAYGVQAYGLSTGAVLLVMLYSLPICLLVDAILHANNLRDARDDRAANVNTLASVLSPRGGQMLQLFLLFGPVVFVIIGVLVRFLPLWSLGTLLAVPLLMRAARTGSVEGTAQTHLAFGLLYTVSLLLTPMFL